MNRDEALAILNKPVNEAIAMILILAEKAEKYDQLQQTASPNTPSGMTPAYLKPTRRKRHKKPGQKPGHPGKARQTPKIIHQTQNHTLQSCPQCHTPLKTSIRSYKRTVEDVLPSESHVTEHTVQGYWCPSCKTIVSPVIPDAMPGSMIGIRTIVYTAWLHYFIGISLRNIVTLLSASAQLKITAGGLSQAWQRLAVLLTPHYDTIRQKIKESAVLHIDETGWRKSGKSFWLWCFTTRTWCYYVISHSRGSPVVKRIIGAFFKGILICDFFGAYNKIDAMAKQRCFFHLAGELEKTDKRNRSPHWKQFRKKLSRLMNDAIRLSKNEFEMEPNTYVRRVERLKERLLMLIHPSSPDKDVCRLKKRLLRHCDELLSFLEYNDVSPYNNHAEQQIRRAVIMRKISQQNRSDKGAETQAILMSLFKSFHMQGLNPIEAVLFIARNSISNKRDDAKNKDKAA